MSAVNHETPPVVVGGLVQEDAMAQQQQDAGRPANAPIAAHIPPAAAKPAPAPVKETSVFHQLSAMVLVTLDLSQNYMMGLKGELSSVDLGDETLNMYSPFRKAPKAKGSDLPAPAGVLRTAINDIFDITDALNDSKILILGKPSEAINSIDKSVKATRGQIEALLPLAPATVLASITDNTDGDEGDEGEEGDEAEKEEGDAFDVTFRHIIRATSWVNTPRTSGQAHEVEAIAKHNAVFNLTVNAGALYDATEPVKYVSQVETVLRLIQTKRTASGTPGETGVLLAVLLNPSDLAEKSNREMFDALIEDLGFTLYTRAELYEPEMDSWTPSTKAEVERELLTARGDMLLVKSLDEPDADEADDDADGAAAE